MTPNPVPARLTRRSLLGLGLGLGALAATGCAGFTPGGDKQAANTIDVAWWGGTDRAEVHEAALKLFGERHPDVTITSQFADQGPYFERLATSAAAGNLPDVFWLTDTYLGRYANSGNLLNLDTHFGKAINVDDIGTASVDYGRTDKGVFGLTSHFNGQAVLTNAPMLEKRGVDYATVKSWTDLTEAGGELTDAKAGVYGLNDPTLREDQRGFEAWVRQAGAEMFSPEGGLGFTADHLGDWLAYWDKLRKAKTIPPADMQTESDAGGWTSDMFVTNKAAIRLSSATHLAVAQALTKTPLAINTYPADADASKDWGFFTALFLAADAKVGNPDVAAQLVDFLVNDVEAAKITQITMGVPAAAPVSKAILPLLDETQQKVVGHVVEEMGYPRRPTPIKPEGSEQLITAIRRASQEVAYGRQAVNDAAKQVIAEAPNYLKS